MHILFPLLVALDQGRGGGGGDYWYKEGVFYKSVL